VKQDPQNRRYPKPRKARKRNKKKRLKPTPPSPTVTGALCTQIKETHTKRGTTRDHLQHRRKLSVPSPQRLLHSPSTHPTPSPTPNPDYSWTPNVTKSREKAEATISSESASDSYYSDCFDSAKAPDPTLTNAHMGTPTKQSVHSIEACYKTPVGHFQVKYEARRKVEVQHPKHVNQRRVGKKKPSNPRTKSKRNEERRVESKIYKQLHQRRKNMRLKQKKRTSLLGTDQRQVNSLARTTGNRTLAVPSYISTSSS
jgi:predicted XRE-type DNA-binding protein